MQVERPPAPSPGDRAAGPGAEAEGRERAREIQTQGPHCRKSSPSTMQVSIMSISVLFTGVYVYALLDCRLHCSMYIIV